MVVDALSRPVHDSSNLSKTAVHFLPQTEQSASQYLWNVEAIAGDDTQLVTTQNWCKKYDLQIQWWYAGWICQELVFGWRLCGNVRLNYCHLRCYWRLDLMKEIENITFQKLSLTRMAEYVTQTKKSKVSYLVCLYWHEWLNGRFLN
jgi:hypothetical protein